MVAREIVYALPAELSEDGRRRVAREIAREIRGMTGAAVDVNVHAPSRDPGADERNHHAHIQWTARAVDERGQFAAKKVDPFSLKEGPQLVRELRHQAAVITNVELAREGHAARVDARSYAEQDKHLPPELQRLPTTHLGPAHTTLERSGVATIRGDLNRAARAHTVELSDPVERHRLLKAAVTYNGQVRGSAVWELDRLPQALSAEGIAYEQRRFWSAFDRTYQKPEKAREQFLGAPEGQRLRTLREQPETFGKLHEAETGRRWAGLVIHTDGGEFARGVAAEAVHRYDRWVLQPTAAAAAAVPKRDALTREIAEADQWGPALGAEVQRVRATPEFVRAERHERAAQLAGERVLEQARQDARQGGRDYAQERAHLRIEQLAKQSTPGPGAPPPELQRDARTIWQELQRQVTKEIAREISHEHDRGRGR